ncbi:STAS domain-containing protein [Lentzea sp. BCCO 10_0798]|uniref:Anti-sigma factor antagonist n=1 Tax=Lentzea kristufekii TaxID=3095430 RepID=A0ABU4TWV8_9PSEU|nr:STAS domain-containing protein [Lentzea sp. BCCO 10_0798]MDX8052779.1 STAS domain-containing protein [Lentzea sp. BCCO 10_0798]
MTAVLQPSRVAVVPLLANFDVELLTVTARPVVSGAVVLAVRGEVDSCTSPLLKIRLLEHVRPTDPPLVIDLTDVSFLGAAGLTVLVTVREAAMAAGIALCLVGCTRPVLLPLKVTGLDGVFDICPDIAHALLRLGCGPDG